MINPIFPWVYLVGIAAAEIIVGYWSIRGGMVLHIILLFAVLVQASISYYRAEPQENEQGVAGVANSREAGAFLGYRFYIGLTLAPMIRILSLAIPLRGVNMQYWYLITGIPLLAATLTAIKLAGYSRRDICLCPGEYRAPLRNMGLHMAVALIGIPLGFMEYLILRPDPLIPQLTAQGLITMGLILIIFTGFSEELLFRGVLKKAADDLMGEERSLIYVSLMFAVMHITHISMQDVVFVFGVAVLFTLLVRRTGSLYGVSLAHGLTNINLFIIAPLLLG